MKELSSLSGTTHLQDCSLLWVSLHFLLNGQPCLLSLGLGQQCAVEDSPAVLTQGFNKLELVVIKEQNQFVLTVMVVCGILIAQWMLFKLPSYNTPLIRTSFPLTTHLEDVHDLICLLLTDYGVFEALVQLPL